MGIECCLHEGLDVWRILHEWMILYGYLTPIVFVSDIVRYLSEDRVRKHLPAPFACSGRDSLQCRYSREFRARPSAGRYARPVSLDRYLRRWCSRHYRGDLGEPSARALT